MLTLHSLLVLLVTSGFLGGAYPPVVAVIMREKWSTRAKTILSLALIVAAAVGTVIGEGQWSGWTRASLLVVGADVGVYVAAVWGSYSKLWQNLGVTQWIERAIVIGRRVDSAAVKLWAKLPQSERDELTKLALEEAGKLKADTLTPSEATA